MPYRSTFAGNLHVIRWLTATAPDALRVVDEVASHKRRNKGPLHGLAIVGEEVPPPDDVARKAMGESMTSLLDHMETLHVVIEGRGFKNTIMRSAMTGMVLLGGKRGRVHIHGSVSEAIYALAEVTDQSVDSLNRQLREAKLIDLPAS
jgi:hypothetical protein